MNFPEPNTGLLKLDQSSGALLDAPEHGPPRVYSILWFLDAAQLSLHAASSCAAEQRQVSQFWSNCSTIRIKDDRQIERVIAREKRRRAHHAFWQLLRALVLLRAGSPIR